MQSGNKKIKRILEKYEDVFEALENYDKTRTLPFERKRIDITLPVGTINKLKQLKEKTGKPISKIIEERIEKRAETAPKTSSQAKRNSFSRTNSCCRTHPFIYPLNSRD